MKTEKPHISISQVGMYTRCGEQYRRRYVEGEKIPPGIAAVKGISVHKGAEFNFKAKIQSKKDKPVGDVVDYAVATLEGQIENEGITLSPDEKVRGQKVIMGEAKDRTAKMASVLMTQVAPRYQPVTVEETVNVPLPTSSHDLKGIIDLEAEGGTIVDLKTSARAWNQERVDKSIQLPFYGMMKRALTGKDPEAVVVENIVDGSKMSNVTFSRKVGMNDYETVIRRLNRILEGINKGVYTPANPETSWWCSSTWCGYWTTCPFGGKK
jgi:hypothetical protein